MLRIVLSLLLAAAAEAATQHEEGAELQLRAKRISPRLEPKSDKKFFGKDYPWDQRPVADKYYVFKHPYPAVQDTGDYDQDFVKDENSDNGQWNAQMDYDILRKKIREAKKKLDKLKEKMEKAYKDWQNAKADAGHAADDLGDAAAGVAKAKAEAEASNKAVNDLEGSSRAEGTKVGGTVGEAVKEVEDEMKDLEDCKKKLAEAKKKLKKLLKEKEETDKKAKKEKEEEEKRQAEEERKLKEQEDAEEKARAEEEAKAKGEAKDSAAKLADERAKWDEAAWQKKLAQEKEEHAQAIKNYEKELMDVKRTEDQLARAAENLRKFRRPPYVDNGGGVYNVPKSSAFERRVPFFCVILAGLLQMW